MSSAAHQSSPPSRLLRVGLHALLVGLVVLVVLRDWRSDPWIVVPGLALVLVYAAGTRLLRGPARAMAWCLALLVVWAVLLWATADAVWVAFPLFFVFLHVLPRVAGLVAVAVTTAAAVAAYGWHDRLVPASVIGPLIGAGVAVGTVWAFEAVFRESQQRQRLIEELTATREELDQTQRLAGATAERERLAREIHDTLAQGLTSIQLLLRAAQRDLVADPGAAGERLEMARAAAQENLDEARRFVRDLPPTQLERGTLPQAVRAVTRNAARRSGIPVRFVVEGDERPVPAAASAALLRIAQSALGNALEHAAAERIGVTLTYMDQSVSLDVVDDGCGFEPARGRAGDGDRGFGLPTMRSRAEAAGGHLSVESTPGEGTAVSAVFPLVETTLP